MADNFYNDMKPNWHLFVIIEQRIVFTALIMRFCIFNNFSGFCLHLSFSLQSSVL